MIDRLEVRGSQRASLGHCRWRSPDPAAPVLWIHPVREYALRELARCAQDPRLHYGVKLHFSNLDVDLDNSEHVQRARRPLLGKHELLTRCIFSGDGGELHGLKRSSIHIHAGSPRGSGEHEDLAKVPETLRFLAAVVC